MATLESSMFGIRLSGVPMLNLRLDFNDLLALFRSDRFRRQFLGHRGESIPIKTHYFTWHGRPEVLLTYLLRDAIVSIESAVGSAVFSEALTRGVMTKDLLEATKNPFALPGRGTANLVFNALPGLIDPEFALDQRDPEIWDKTCIFYREVRNPIFHAYEIADSNPDSVWQALEFIQQLFQWLNSWHDIASVTGPIQMDTSRLTEIPKISDLRVEQIVPERSVPPNPERDSTLPKDLEQAPDIEDVLGMYLPSEHRVCLTMRSNLGNHVNMELSPHAAMKLLVFLAKAHEQRGWALPDRI